MWDFGKFSILSFNGNKIITTGGGGALISIQKNIDLAKYYSTQAREKNILWAQKIGYNYNQVIFPSLVNTIRKIIKI